MNIKRFISHGVSLSNHLGLQFSRFSNLSHYIMDTYNIIKKRKYRRSLRYHRFFVSSISNRKDIIKNLKNNENRTIDNTYHLLDNFARINSCSDSDKSKINTKNVNKLDNIDFDENTKTKNQIDSSESDSYFSESESDCSEDLSSSKNKRKTLELRLEQIKKTSQLLYQNHRDTHPGQIVCGVDEAGRGPLAGPVVCGAVMSAADGSLPEIEGICDSKMLSEAQREQVYEEIIKKFPENRWKAVIVPRTKIDKINILEATFEGMTEAVEGIIEGVSEKEKASLIVVDGPHIPRKWKAEDETGSKKEGRALNGIKVEAVVKGDSKEYLIAAASIIAKVTRDRLMVDLDKKYPVYGFAKHRGYGTKFHMDALEKHGPCDEHRTSFEPVRVQLKKRGLLNSSSSEEEEEFSKMVKKKTKSSRTGEQGGNKRGGQASSSIKMGNKSNTTSTSIEMMKGNKMKPMKEKIIEQKSMKRGRGGGAGKSGTISNENGKLKKKNIFSEADAGYEADAEIDEIHNKKQEDEVISDWCGGTGGGAGSSSSSSKNESTTKIVMKKNSNKSNIKRTSSSSASSCEGGEPLKKKMKRASK